MTRGVHPDNWLGLHGASVEFDLTQENSLSCTDCHGEDLDGGYVDVSCKACHLGRSNGCIICHGGVIDNSGAPPVSISGDSSAAVPGVGAHTAHVAEATISADVACSQCHPVPEFSFSDNHFGPDSTAEIVFGDLADKNGSATYAFANNTCSGTYCHGNFNGGYVDNAPIWTDISGVQDSCGSCHYAFGSRARDLGGRHKKHVEDGNLECYECHFATVDETRQISSSNMHIDGENTIEFRLGGIWENQWCSSLDTGCHGGNRRWN